MGDYFYITASGDDTLVEVTNKINFYLQAGQTRQITIGSSEYLSIKANKPILVAQVRCLQLQQTILGSGSIVISVLIGPSVCL